MKNLLGRAIATAILLAPALGQAHIPQCKTLDCIRDEVTKIANRSFARQDFVGMSVVVVDRDKGSFNSHFGYQDLAKKTPTSKHTIYEIGSITKPFTFLALALQDKVKLDDPISKYLPKGVRAPKPAGKDILMKHLITHTAEINSIPCVAKKPEKIECFHEPSDKKDPYKNLTKEGFYKFIDASAQMHDDFPEFFTAAPGYFEDYSNMAAALAGEIVASTQGMSYEGLIRERILKPLKMTSSYLAIPCPKGPGCDKFAKVYTREKSGDQWQETTHWALPFAKGAGALKSTSADMEKFLRANLIPNSSSLQKGIERGQSLLADVTATRNSRMCQSGEKPRDKRCNSHKRDLYWAWLRSRSAPLLWHNGGTGGSRTMLEFTQDGSFGVIVLQNSKNPEYSFPYEFANCIMYIAGKRSNPSWCERFDG